MISWWSWLSLLETFSSQFFFYQSIPFGWEWSHWNCVELGEINEGWRHTNTDRLIGLFHVFDYLKLFLGTPQHITIATHTIITSINLFIACISELIFPTCQMRVVRFYVSCPRPPSVPRRTRTATSGAKCSLPDLQYMSKYLSEYMPWNTMVGITRSIFFLCQYQFINIIVLPNGMFDSSASLVFLMQMLAQWLRSFSPGR